MESKKELPTAEAFITRKALERDFKDNEFPTPQQVFDLVHEYAVLFAKYHRKRQIEAIDKIVLNNYLFEKRTTINDIENAYSEENIR